MYTIENDGDVWEKRFHPRLFPLFPNYDEFWRIVIVPMTIRENNGGIDLRPAVNRDLELLAMSHYSCYYHLGVASELLESVGKLPCLYDDFFLHLGASVEMINERFLVYCDKIWEQTGLLETRRRFVDMLGDNWRVCKAAFDALAEEASLYRNATAHNPKLAQALDRNTQKFWYPNKAALDHNKNMTWSDVAKLSFPSDFVERESLVYRLMAEVTSSINALWPELIGLFKYLMTLNAYRDLIPTNVRPTEVGVIGYTTGHGVRYAGAEPNDDDAYSSASGTSYRPSLNDL
jgi:hypothetical protein